MKRTKIVGLGALVLATLPSAAHAFSEPLLYPEPTTAGGGGGRFFTGSPLDSFSCAVCHSGGPRPVVTLRGLPESFEPGETYDLELSWTEARNPHAATLEIVDAEGKAAGKLALPDEEDVEDDARCILSEDPAQREQVASAIFPYAGREILTVTGCGARNVRFTYTAPRDARKIALTASIVRSDKSEDIEGDGVLELRRVVERDGAGQPGVRPTFEGGALVALLLAALASLVVRRRISASRG